MLTGDRFLHNQTRPRLPTTGRVDDGAMETFPGYRLVRKLGEGPRAEVWLCHSLQSDDRVTAMKIFRATTTAESVDSEIEALTRARSPHLLALDDLATGADGRPSLILPRLSTTTLSKLLVSRTSIGAGEIVTAMVPILGAVAELHRVGVVHGAIDGSTVFLDRSGAPVLAAFGHAAIVGAVPVRGGQSLTPVAKRADTRVKVDVENLVALIGALVARVSDPMESAPAIELTEWMRSSLDDDGFLDTLSNHLFELAVAMPLLLEDPPIRSSRAATSIGRVIPLRDPHSVPRARGSRPKKLVPRLAWAVHSRDDGSIVGSSLRQLRALIAPVRKPVWVAGGAGLLALVVAFTVIPSAGADNAARTGQSDARSPLPPVSPLAPAAGPSPKSTTPPTSTTPGQWPDSPKAASDSSSGQPGAIGADDPVAATMVLLARRQRCFESSGLNCLDRVDQNGSAALEADRYSLGRMASRGMNAAEIESTTTLSLVQRLGDSAIIGVGVKGADSLFARSLLVVKVEGEWRIRDLTTAASAG